MPEIKTNGHANQSDSDSQEQTHLHKRSGPFGWVPLAFAIAALVYFPVVMAGDSGWGPVRGIGGFSSIKAATVSQEQLPVANPFGVTIANDFGTPVDTNMTALVLVGSNGGGGNQYDMAEISGIPFTVDSQGNFRTAATGNEPLTLGPNLPALFGACCAAPFGFVADGFFNTAITTPGNNTQEVSIQTSAPYTVTFNDLGPGVHVSSFYDAVQGRFVASTYNLSTGRVQIYTREMGSSTWTPVNSVPCDSPFSNVHWWQITNTDGSKTFVMCRNGGPVELSRVDLTTGNLDWTVAVGSMPVLPSEFTYFHGDLTGELNLPGGGSGEGMAFLIPAATNSVGVVADVGTPAPPMITTSTTIPGQVSDRWSFKARGPIVTGRIRGPDGTGAQTMGFNFGDLSAPPTTLILDDDSNTPIFGGSPPDSVATTNDTLFVLPQRDTYIDATATNLTSTAVDTVTAFSTHENGTATEWSSFVGGTDSPEKP